MYEFIQKNNEGKQEIKQSQIERKSIQMKIHTLLDKENLFPNVRVKQKNSVLPIIQMTKETEQGLVLWDRIMEISISDSDILIEDDPKHGTILAMVDLKNKIDSTSNDQLHMHVKCEKIGRKQRDTDIQVSSEEFASIMMDIDIKNGKEYLLYLEKTDERVENFIEKCLSKQVKDILTEKARQALINKYRDEHGGRRPMDLLTGLEQIQLGDYHYI